MINFKPTKRSRLTDDSRFIEGAMAVVGVIALGAGYAVLLWWRG